MVTCSHCGQPVDETVRTTCPLCFTPLPNQAQTPSGGQPQAGASQPAAGAPLQPTTPLNQPTPVPLGGGAPPPVAPLAGTGLPAGSRMSLTGEIIQTPSSGGPATTGGPGSYQGNTPAPRPAYTASRRVEAAPARSGSRGIVAVLIVLLLLGLGGFGGWYWWMHRTNPKDQAQKFFTALKSQDWKSVYELSKLPADQQGKFTSAQDFADKTQAQLNKTPGISNLLTTVLSTATFEAGDPTDNDGSQATVPVKTTISLLGRSQTQSINLKMTNDNGIWKVDSGAAGGMGGIGMPGGGFAGFGGGRAGSSRGSGGA